MQYRPCLLRNLRHDLAFQVVDLVLEDLSSLYSSHVVDVLYDLDLTMHVVVLYYHGFATLHIALDIRVTETAFPTIIYFAGQFED